MTWLRLARLSNLSRRELRITTTSGEGVKEISIINLRNTQQKQSLPTDYRSLCLQLSHHFTFINLNHKRVTVFADDSADGVNKGKEGTRFVGRRSEQDL